MSTSLKWYLDAALTNEVTPPLSVSQEVLGAAVDTVIYLGSIASAKTFQALSNPGVDTIDVNIVNLTPIWLASTVMSLNDLRRTTAKNGYRYKVTVAGTTAATEPTWPTSVGATVVDGTVTWINDGELHESTEIKLATAAAGLDAAVAGDPLSLGVQISSGAGNSVAVFMRLDDATDINATMTELSIQTVDIQET